MAEVMEEKELKLSIRIYSGIAELPDEDEQLMQQAVSALSSAYAPYSGFKVAAALLLANGKIVTGTNQENAAFPAGICAEGTAFSAASSLYPDTAVLKMAVTVRSEKRKIERPVAPCGICRQRMLEYETRFAQAIEIIMTGECGVVYSVQSAKDLLPLYFSQQDF